MREISIPPKKATTRYGCDFCKKTTARKITMERHEAMCYYNPDRNSCPMCGDASGTMENYTGYGSQYSDCPPCKTAEEALRQRGLGYY